MCTPEELYTFALNSGYRIMLRGGLDYHNAAGQHNHKGAIAPLYIGLASIAPIHSENPHFCGNRHSIRIPSSQKGTYGQNMGALKMTKIG